MNEQKKLSLFYRTFIILHTVQAWTFSILATILFGTLAMVFGMFHLSNLSHYSGTAWGWSLKFFSAVKVKIENKDNLYKKGPVIVISNHQSIYDVPIMYVVLNIQFRWMAKDTVFKIPFLGWGMKGAGYIPVNRDNRKEALKSLFEAAKRIHDGKSVLVFPEGTRSHLPEGKMLPFKNGGFMLAKKAGVVIQPMTVWGTKRVIPKQKQYKIQRVYPGKCIAHLHKAIMPEEYENMSLNELSQYLRNILEEPMEQMQKELPL